MTFVIDGTDRGTFGMTNRSCDPVPAQRIAAGIAQDRREILRGHEPPRERHDVHSELRRPRQCSTRWTTADNCDRWKSGVLANRERFFRWYGPGMPVPPKPEPRVAQIPQVSPESVRPYPVWLVYLEVSDPIGPRDPCRHNNLLIIIPIPTTRTLHRKLHHERKYLGSLGIKTLQQTAERRRRCRTRAGSHSRHWRTASFPPPSSGPAAAPRTSGATLQNWDLSRAPIAGDDLVFGAQASATAAPPTTSSTLPVFNSITIAASGYIDLRNRPADGARRRGQRQLERRQRYISSDIQLFAPSGTLQQTFTVNSGSTLMLTGVIDGRNDGLEAQQTFTKAGPGVMELTRDNTAYTGAVALANSGGVVVISHHNALGIGASRCRRPLGRHDHRQRQLATAAQEPRRSRDRTPDPQRHRRRR